MYFPYGHICLPRRSFPGSSRCGRVGRKECDYPKETIEWEANTDIAV